MAEQKQQPTAEVLDKLKYNEAGLIPAVAQQHDTGEVLMMAWMNRASIEETLETSRVCYWSRSRQDFWRKGESSGQVQMLKGMRFDCDLDTILLLVDQEGAACHTGRRHCFFYIATAEKVVIDSEPMVDPETLYGKK
uniref:Phosphoribosyl-AMP cyclohydrolase n=1 Tax=uncultured Thiotrichaceae bacterium TaxID=298394 RepID=A0A6S6SCR9_9GAMM|nr:MAG: Phosphoribosyl-AMP cyclohydrolase (EC [uncultured Thiotrichaceae bacterium]